MLAAYPFFEVQAPLSTVFDLQQGYVVSRFYTFDTSSLVVYSIKVK